MRTTLKVVSITAVLWLVLFSGPTAAQEPNFVLGDVVVYGTERFDAAVIRSEFASELQQLVAAMTADDGRRTDRIVARIKEQLNSRGPFAYLSISTSSDVSRAPNFTVFVTVDVVEKADRDRRMPFRTPPAGRYRDPDRLFRLWEEYEASMFELMMAGSLPANSECPVLHCLFGFDHPDLKPFLASFNEGASRNEDVLYEIAEGDRDASHRSTAILLLAHTNNVDRLLPVLGRAIYDPDGVVRNYAMRVMIMLARDDPERNSPVDDLVAALDFPESTDRNKSAATLLALCESPIYREIIRREALPTLLQLMRTGPPINHEPAYDILRELSGEDFGPRDYTAWEDWVHTELAENVIK